MDVSVLFLDIQGLSSIIEGYDQLQVEKDFKCNSIGTYSLKNVSGQTEIFEVEAAL